MIYADTREQKNEHILNYFKRHNIDYEIKKVDTGDYYNPLNPKVAIEKKRSLGELASNLCTKDSSRFYREIRRAHEQGIELIILCEHGYSIKSLQDVANWNSQYSKITGKQLQSEMYRVGIAYNVTWLFCDKRSTGKQIYELLKVK